MKIFLRESTQLEPSELVLGGNVKSKNILRHRQTITFLGMIRSSDKSRALKGRLKPSPIKLARVVNYSVSPSWTVVDIMKLDIPKVCMSQ